MAYTQITDAVKAALKATQDDDGDLQERIKALHGAVYQTRVRQALMEVHAAAENDDLDAVDQALDKVGKELGWNE